MNRFIASVDCLQLFDSWFSGFCDESLILYVAILLVVMEKKAKVELNVHSLPKKRSGGAFEYPLGRQVKSACRAPDAQYDRNETRKLASQRSCPMTTDS